MVLGVALERSLWTLKFHNLGCGCSQYITLYHVFMDIVRLRPDLTPAVGRIHSSVARSYCFGGKVICYLFVDVAGTGILGVACRCQVLPD